MLKVAVCDDDDVILDKLCEKICTEFKFCAIGVDTECFTNGLDFIEKHRQTQFDAIFLDIVMPDMSGFEVAGEVRTISENTYIIFVTTEDSLVYDSFSFQPFDFIPKNLNQNADFFEAKLKSVVQRLADRFKKFKEIILPQPYDEALVVNATDVLFIKTSGNYVEYSIKNRTPVRVRAKLDDVEKELEPSAFLRLHKSYIVNMDFIKTINYSQLLATLKDGTIVTISKTHKKNVEACYMNYIRSLGR